MLQAAPLRQRLPGLPSLVAALQGGWNAQEVRCKRPRRRLGRLGRRGGAAPPLAFAAAAAKHCPPIPPLLD